MYCEANFDAVDGKTANGLVRHSERFEILSIIDSRCAGRDAGAVLGGPPNGVPVCRDLAHALAHAGGIPGTYIFGIAPVSGTLSARERVLLLEAIGLGMNVVNGLHQLLNDDPEFVAAAAATGAEIEDVRRPPGCGDAEDVHGPHQDGQLPTDRGSGHGLRHRQTYDCHTSRRRAA